MTATQSLQTPPQVGAYVLPAPPRGPGGLLAGAFGVPSSQFAAAHVREALAGIGGRLDLLLACQQRFLDELRTTVQEMDESVHEESRARMKAQIHTLRDILEWCDAVQSDLCAESAQALRGHQAVDLVAALHAAVAEFSTRHAQVPVQVVGSVRRPWWGSAAQLREILDLGLQLVAERIGGQGAIHVEMAEAPDEIRMRMFGRGEPTNERPWATAHRFRQVADTIGVKVRPDETGTGGTGFLLVWSDVRERAAE